MERADWLSSPGTEESASISNEHIALIEFAQRLGSEITNKEPGIADANNVRQDANLLMSLLSFTPHVVSDDIEHNSVASLSSASDQQYHSDSSMTSSYRRDSFRFSHPSLSLDCRSYAYDRPLRTPCTAPDKIEENASDDEELPKNMPLPAVLLGRALRVDDREALRLSADAMARNLLQSFQKAIQWRIKSWMNDLSVTLVQQEKELVRQNASQEEVKKLLETREARLFLKLREVEKMIDVQHAETRFHVLPQRVQRDAQKEEEATENPQKRRRIDSEDSEVMAMAESEYEYSVCHALEFNGAIYFVTPAGHSQIRLEVPGIIEGVFLSSETGMEDLRAVEVEIDTNILSSMVEKSCRIIVRSSIEQLCKGQETAEVPEREEKKEEENKEAPEAVTKRDEDVASPHPSFQGSMGSRAAIVTPRAKASFFDKTSNDEAVYLPIPDELDSTPAREPRRISPQPHSLDMVSTPFTPMTPSQPEIKQSPSMVSPAPKAVLDNQETGFRLAKRGHAFEQENKQNLPVLVEVACAQMQVSTGLTGQ